MEDIKKIIVLCDSFGYQKIDMFFQEVVGMFIIRVKYDLFWIFFDQWDKGIKILGGVIFLDKDFYVQFCFVVGFFEGEIFVVGRDFCSCILLGFLFFQAGCMAIYRFFGSVSFSNFSYYFFFFVQYIWVVYYFCQVRDFWYSQ